MYERGVMGVNCGTRNVDVDRTSRQWRLTSEMEKFSKITTRRCDDLCIAASTGMWPESRGHAWHTSIANRVSRYLYANLIERLFVCASELSRANWENDEVVLRNFKVRVGNTTRRIFAIRCHRCYLEKHQWPTKEKRERETNINKYIYTFNMLQYYAAQNLDELAKCEQLRFAKSCGCLANFDSFWHSLILTLQCRNIFSGSYY